MQYQIQAYYEPCIALKHMVTCASRLVKNDFGGLTMIAGNSIRVGVWAELEAELQIITPKQIATVSSELGEDMDGFHPVGTIADGDVLQKLWVLIGVYADALADTMTILVVRKTKADDEEVQRLRGIAARQQRCVELLKQTFWAELELRFPKLAPRGAIGIRHGWQVGWLTQKQEKSNHGEIVAVAVPAELVAMFAGLGQSKRK